jgi:hypothetical protein
VTCANPLCKKDLKNGTAVSLFGLTVCQTCYYAWLTINRETHDDKEPAHLHPLDLQED